MGEPLVRRRREQPVVSRGFHGYGCPNCAAKVGFNAKRCRSCGQSVRYSGWSATKVADEDEEAGSSPQQRRRRPPSKLREGGSVPPVNGDGAQPPPFDGERTVVSTSRHQQPCSKNAAVVPIFGGREGCCEPFAKKQDSVDRAQLTPCETFSTTELCAHLSSLRCEPLHRSLRQLVQRLMFHSLNQGWFNEPVDAEKLNLPDYYELISRPMDLGTIKSKLSAFEYPDVESFAADVKLVFENAQRYNPPKNAVHNAAVDMTIDFESELSRAFERIGRSQQRTAEHECGLCQGKQCVLCGDKCLSFETPSLICSGPCSQKVRRDQNYHVTRDGSRLWCHKCFLGLKSVIPPPPECDYSGAGADASLGLWYKRDLIKRKFDEDVAEPWVQCDSCGRWVHQTCALFNAKAEADQGGDAQRFVCPLCELQKTHIELDDDDDEDYSCSAQPGCCSLTAPQSSSLHAPAPLLLKEDSSSSLPAPPPPLETAQGAEGAADPASYPPAVVLMAAAPSFQHPEYAAVVVAEEEDDDDDDEEKKQQPMLNSIRGAISGMWNKAKKSGSSSTQDDPQIEAQELTTEDRSSSDGKPEKRKLVNVVSTHMDEETYASVAAVEAAKQHGAGKCSCCSSSRPLRLTTLTSTRLVLEPDLECDVEGASIRRHQEADIDGWEERPKRLTVPGSQVTVRKRRWQGSLAYELELVDGSSNNGEPARDNNDLVKKLKKRTWHTVSALESKQPQDDSFLNSDDNFEDIDAAIAAANAAAQSSPDGPAAKRLKTTEPSSTSTSSQVSRDEEELDEEQEEEEKNQSASSSSSTAAAAAAAAVAGEVEEEEEEEKQSSSSANLAAEEEEQPTRRRSRRRRSSAVDSSDDEESSSEGGCRGEGASSSAAAAAAAEEEEEEEEEAAAPPTMPLPPQMTAGDNPASSDKNQWWSAARLRETQMTRHLELAVRKRMVELGTAAAELAHTVVVRVVSAVPQSLRVPAVLRRTFANPDGTALPEVLPFESRAVAMFQRMDGVDLCVFSMYVHEFGDSGAEGPSARRVYIAYLDSVEYFRPRTARTAIYHELLVAYLDWSKRRGYEAAHIWACPPQRGNNFIFWCHPPHQRTPSKDRLALWYRAMIARAVAVKAVTRVATLYDEHYAHLDTLRRHNHHHHRATPQQGPREQSNSKSPAAALGSSHKRVVVDAKLLPEQTPVCPPLFDGDYWPDEACRLHALIERRKGLFGSALNTGSYKGSLRSSSDQQLGTAAQLDNLLKTVLQQPSTYPFMRPVDYLALDVPDYPKIITEPMDLGTVEKRLQQRQYATPQPFVSDVRLVFSNAQRFNPPAHPIHEAAVQLSLLFEKKLQSFLTRLKQKLGDKFEGDLLALVRDHKLYEEDEAAVKEEEEGEEKQQQDQPQQQQAAAADEGGASEEAEAATPVITKRRRGSSAGAAQEEAEVEEESGVPPAPLIEDDEEEMAPLPKEEVEESAAAAPLLPPKRTRRSTSKDSKAAPPAAASSPSIDHKAQHHNENKKAEKSASEKKKRKKLKLLREETTAEEEEEEEEPARHLEEEEEAHLQTTPRESAIEAAEQSGGELLASNMPMCSRLPAELAASVHKMKDALFVLYLQDDQIRTKRSSSDNAASLEEEEEEPRRRKPPLVDPDAGVQISCPLLDSRHTFLEMCQFWHLQFDSLRRAKHSSVMLLYHMHNPKVDSLRILCSHCVKEIRRVRWHCSTCISYNICRHCERQGRSVHPHVLTPYRITFSSSRRRRESEQTA